MIYQLHSEADNRKDADYDLVVIPEHLGTLTRPVSDDKVSSFAFAQGSYGSWYFEDSPFGGPICHPMIFANDLLFLFYEVYDGNTAEGLHTMQKLTFHSPARPGEQVTVTGDYVEKYEKRGQGCVVLLAQARGEDGRLLVTHEGTEIMRTRVAEVAGRDRGSGTGRRVEAMIDDSHPTASWAESGIAERTGLPSQHRHFSQDQMNVFSWLAHGYRNVHTDLAKARQSGAERTIVQALQQTGIIVDVLVDFFGASWFTTGSLDLRYINPAYCEEELTARACVIGERDGMLELEVWVEGAAGQKKVVGWASAQIPEVDPDRPRPLLSPAS
ncbi:MAG: MaoC family dehydratase N-terminal domain-containing protein [Beutenbergiaceae bacterium]